jgi:endonuclease-3
VQSILKKLTSLYGEATCELEHASPFQLLCATILSAQCTDERVNQVTPILFARFPTPALMASASQPEVEAIIHSTGFFRHKAKNLIGTARIVSDEFQGIVPGTMEDLLRLPGVARKTANVVLGTAYGLATGVVVDTHVSRLSQRLALTRATTPERIELDLMSILPKTRWILFSHQLIWHGRRVCRARNPLCDTCALVPYCPSAFRSN